jgi:hypothetical protein
MSSVNTYEQDHLHNQPAYQNGTRAYYPYNTKWSNENVENDSLLSFFRAIYVMKEVPLRVEIGHRKNCRRQAKL